MNAFNHLICAFFDLVFYPFASLNPLWGLVVTSVATGVMMLFIFRCVSDQPGIRKIKNRIKARIFELRLFGHDLGLMWESQKDLCRDNLAYLKFSVKPMLLMIVPVGLIMIQSGVWFARHPIEAGTSAIVRIKFDDQAPFNENFRLRVPEGIVIETPALRIPEEKEIDWRIKALKEGTYALEFDSDSAMIGKTIIVDSRLARLSLMRVSSNWLSQLLYPAEKSLPPGSGLDYIEVGYPTVSYHILGWKIHWLVIFFVISIATGLILKAFFRIEM